MRVGCVLDACCPIVGRQQERIRPTSALGDPLSKRCHKGGDDHKGGEFPRVRSGVRFPQLRDGVGVGGGGGGGKVGADSKIPLLAQESRVSGTQPEAPPRTLTHTTGMPATERLWITVPRGPGGPRGPRFHN